MVFGIDLFEVVEQKVFDTGWFEEVEQRVFGIGLFGGQKRKFCCMYYVDFQGTFVGVLDKKDQIIGLQLQMIVSLVREMSSIVF